jgi:predicted metalloprotease with PDZ domain
MWRGGLSGPRSLFIHADLPLISENSTSTLLHEIFHVAFAPYQVEQADWIIEGLSEYYGIMILSRTGGISDKRLKQALDFQAEWGKTTARLCSGDSSGPITARAVTVLSMLDDEIRRETRNRHSLDDVTRDLASGDVEVTLNSLRKSAAKLIGTASESLLAKNLPGCEE